MASVKTGPTSVMGKLYNKGYRSRLGIPEGSNQRARKATYQGPTKGKKA